MRLAKIKNKYLFKSSNPNGNHTYAVYYDKKNKENRAVGLTHLYIKDNKRFAQVKKGMIKIEKFKEFDVPSGVKNRYFNQNSKGGKINLNDKENVKFVSNRFVGKKQSMRIINFATKREK